MPISVADRGSNKPENIEHACEIIGRSEIRRKVFKAIYTNKKAIKTRADLEHLTGLSGKQILMAGKKLSDAGITKQTKIDNQTAYEKDRFFQTHRDQILKLVGNPEKIKEMPTKRRPAQKNSRAINFKVKIQERKIKAKQITIDDIDSFDAVKKYDDEGEPIKIPETKFKEGIAKILKQRGEFKDWGGELSDLTSTKLILNGKRHTVAFAFKGPGKTGKLTPGKMGKNGDQIQRLVQCPAKIYIVQYWNNIEQSVLEQLQNLIQLKSYMINENLYYGIIDGQDSRRIILAYKKYFPSVNI